METHTVYVNIGFLLCLKDASVSERKTMLINITPGRINALSAVALRFVNGTIRTLRRDVQLLERKRELLRTIASDRVCSSRKKALLRRHNSLLPILLRPQYLIQVVRDEVIGSREA